MTGRKKYIAAWCLLALAAIGCLSLAVGVTYARYREDVDGSLELGLRKNAQVYLISGKDPEIYSPLAAQWQQQGESQILEFFVTNTGADAKAPEDTQEFTLRLAASLDVWDGVSEFAVNLVYTQSESADIIQGTVTRIPQDTVLYSQFGDGWLITFPKDGTDMTWELKGGERSHISMQLELTSEQSVDGGLVQLLLEGRLK